MASIRCAHCKATHTAVADVATCAAIEAEMKWEAEMDLAAERFWEEGTEAQQAQYRWEVEADEANARMWRGPYVDHQGVPAQHPPIWR